MLYAMNSIRHQIVAESKNSLNAFVFDFKLVIVVMIESMTYAPTAVVVVIVIYAVRNMKTMIYLWNTRT